MNIQNKYSEMKQDSRAKIMKTLFITTWVLLGFEIIMFFIIKIAKLGIMTDAKTYFLKYSFVPTFCNLFDFSLAFLIMKKAKTEKMKDYAVFSCLYGYCANITIFHGFFIVLPAFFIIPVIVSSLFDNLHYTRFLSVVSCILVLFFTPLSILYDPSWDLSIHLVSTIGILVLICLVQYITTSIIQFSTSKNGLITNSQQVDTYNTEPLSVDPLSGFYNHSAFYDILSKTRDNCIENNTIMTVVLLDIDDFTTINETYGHKNGDQLLIACAEALVKYCGVQSTLFRYGGDKFAAIFRSMTDREVLNYMNEIREELLAKKIPEMPDVVIHASCGISEYHGESIAIKDIIQTLEAAVAKAKSTGGNRSVINRQ